MKSWGLSPCGYSTNIPYLRLTLGTLQRKVREALRPRGSEVCHRTVSPSNVSSFHQQDCRNKENTDMLRAQESPTLHEELKSLNIKKTTQLKNGAQN